MNLSKGITHTTLIPLFAALLGSGIVLAVIVWATYLDSFSTGRAAALLVFLIVSGVLLITRRDALRFNLFFALLALPLLGVIVPPARLGIFAWDYMAVINLILLMSIALRPQRHVLLFPVQAAAWALVLFLPSVVTSVEPSISMIEYGRLLFYYAFFIVAYHYLQDPDELNSFHAFTACALIVVAISIILQKVTGINYGIYQERGYVSAGTALIKQGSGLFQDPQKAGQFIAVLMTYFVILLAQNIIYTRLTRYLLWVAVILSVPSLLMTVSRLAIVSGAVASIGGYIIFSRASFLRRLFSVLFATVCVVAYFGFGQMDLMKSVLPDELQKRFKVAEQSRDVRVKIWIDSWSIFMEYPLTGIGPGTYQEYQMILDPQLRRYHTKGGFVPDQPENGYLKILYEGGVIGAAGILLVLGSVLLRATKVLTGRYPPESKGHTWAILGGGVVFLATFTTLFTTADPRNALLPIMLIAALFSSCRPFDEIEGDGGSSLTSFDDNVDPISAS